MLDYNQIKELIKEIDSSSLRVFELENSDIKLKLSKKILHIKKILLIQHLLKILQFLQRKLKLQLKKL